MKTEVSAGKAQIHYTWLCLPAEPSRIEDESLELAGKKCDELFFMTALCSQL